MADKAAKLAVRRPQPLSRPLTYIPRSTFKTLIKAAILKAWTVRWARSTVRQTKVWFPQPDPRKSRIILSQPRKIFSRFVRFITGHCFLRYQRALVARQPGDPPITPPINPPFTHAISPSPSPSPTPVAVSAAPRSPTLTPPPGSPTPSLDSLARVAHLPEAILCRFCSRHRERAVEVITTCESLWDCRLEAFGAFTLSPSSPTWSPKNMLRFLADPRVSGMERDEPPAASPAAPPLSAPPSSSPSSSPPAPP